MKEKIQKFVDYVISLIANADYVLLGLCLAASIYGLIIISSAAHYMSGGSRHFLMVQGVAVVIGVGLYLLLSAIDVLTWLKHWKVLILINVTLFGLLLTPLGITVNGNRSWLGPQNIGKMLGISFLKNFPVTLQSAEVVKITFILLLAYQLNKLREDNHLREIEGIVLSAGHLVAMVGMIYVVSKDAGSALVYVFIFLGMAIVAGFPMKWIWMGGGAGLAGIVALWQMDLLPTHIQNRIHVLFDHSYDVKGVGWQQSRSLLAIGSGGLTGQGLYKGTMVQSTYSSALPERYNDFIFASIGEELGLVGCVVALLILFAIVFRCFYTAHQMGSGVPSLVCVGIGSMLMFQVIANVGMCLFVFPVVGLTLPFFSYGGTSIVTIYAAMGVVSSVRQHTAPEWMEHSSSRYVGVIGRK